MIAVEKMCVRCGRRPLPEEMFICQGVTRTPTPAVSSCSPGAPERDQRWRHRRVPLGRRLGP
jgi:hypothetical protein